MDDAAIAELPEDYEPKASERAWHRDASTGDRGFLVKRNGRAYIKLDRPMQEILKPYQVGNWIPDLETRPMTRGQLGQIAFEADRKLCFFIGEHDRSKRSWLDLSDEQRIEWNKHGPKGEIRGGLWAAIMGNLARHAG